MHYTALVHDKTYALCKLMRNLATINEFGNTYSIGKVGILAESMFSYLYEKYFNTTVRP